MIPPRRPLALVTNDDGIGCRFLLELVSALSPHFRVVVAAPAGEQSWIGRAFSRNRDVQVEPRDVPGAERAWAVHGTPSDCVNIALGHLLEGERPDIVLSGINIGYNVSMPLGLSSGTVAGAIEGAAWGLRAAAFSLDLPQDAFETLRHANGEATGATLVALRHAASRAAGFATALLAEEPSDELVVHNYNFPHSCDAASPVDRTVPAALRLGSLYEPVESAGVFRFRWNDGENRTPHERTDLAALARGSISHTVLNYSTLGHTPTEIRR
jgi:5'-nucleotidase